MTNYNCKNERKTIHQLSTENNNVNNNMTNSLPPRRMYLSYLFSLLYISVILSIGIFAGKKSLEAIVNINNEFSFDDTDIQSIRGGGSIGRSLTAEEGTVILGIVRNNLYWQDYLETNAGGEDNENAEDGELPKVQIDLRGWISDAECFAGNRADALAPNVNYKGNCYHRPVKNAYANAYTDSATNYLTPTNIINPMHYGEYQTRQEERCALGGGSNCDTETEETEAIQDCAERDQHRCTRIADSYAGKYCIKCCKPDSMVEQKAVEMTDRDKEYFTKSNRDIEKGHLTATWDILCDDNQEDPTYGINADGGNFPTKDLHVYDGGYQFMFVNWAEDTRGNPQPMEVENMVLVECDWGEVIDGTFTKFPNWPWGWPKKNDGLTDKESEYYDKNMQGFHVYLWVEARNHGSQPRKGVRKCKVEPIWEVQKPGKPCTRQVVDGCLYNEKYTIYYENPSPTYSLFLWIPLGLLICGYCISAVVGYAGGWWGQWLDTGVGINWCPTWTK